LRSRLTGGKEVVRPKVGNDRAPYSRNVTLLLVAAVAAGIVAVVGTMRSDKR